MKEAEILLRVQSRYLGRVTVSVFQAQFEVHRERERVLEAHIGQRLQEKKLRQDMVSPSKVEPPETGEQQQVLVDIVCNRGSVVSMGGGALGLRAAPSAHSMRKLPRRSTAESALQFCLCNQH